MKKNIDKNAISLRIRELREKNNLSQIEFSKEINVSQQTISQIEKGIIAPSLEVLAKITSNFCISFDFLINGEETVSNSVSNVKKTTPKTTPNDEKGKVKGKEFSKVWDDMSNNMVADNAPEYLTLQNQQIQHLQEKINLLSQQISLLNQQLADKQQIIDLLKKEEVDFVEIVKKMDIFNTTSTKLPTKTKQELEKHKK